jgi:hypothetical protein
VTTDYAFHISHEVERRMSRCRAPVRAAIRKRLGEIAASAGKSRARARAPDGRAKAPARKDPPLRFYVYEGYRIAYHLDAASRRLVVLNLELLPAD